MAATPNYRAIERALKAVAPAPSSGGYGNTPAPYIGPGPSPLIASYNEWTNGRYTGTGNSLPRDFMAFLSGMMGPGTPIQPVALDLPQSGENLPEPRVKQMPVSWNLPLGQPGSEGIGKLASFQELRTVCDLYSVARDCINLRKNELRGIGWDIGPTRDAAKAMRGDHRAAGDFAERQAKLVSFFRKPDPNFTEFSTWFSAITEEFFVTDATAVYFHPSRLKRGGVLGSNLAALTAIDGATVRPMVTVQGGMPAPPNVAYQQFLWGVPRVDLMALRTGEDMDGVPDDQIVAEYRASQLRYMPFSPRIWSPYGMAFIENALVPVLTGIQKEAYQMNYFDQGTIPGLFVSPGDTSLTAGQLKILQDSLNALAGDQAWKHKIVVLPGGTKADPMRPGPLADDLDTLLQIKTCGGFDVQPFEIGILPQLAAAAASSGTARLQVGARIDLKQRKSTIPILLFLKAAIFDWVIQDVCGQKDMEWKWEGLEEDQNIAELTDALVAQVGAGLLSIDEGRQILGREPWGLPITSDPGWATQWGGLVPLTGVTEATAQPLGGSPGPGGPGRGAKPSGPAPVDLTEPSAVSRPGSPAAPLTVPRNRLSTGQRRGQANQVTSTQNRTGSQGTPAHSGARSAASAHKAIATALNAETLGELTAGVGTPLWAIPGEVAKDSMEEFQDRGEALRQRYGIDGTAGDAQDKPHPFAPDVPGHITCCVACGEAREGRQHDCRCCGGKGEHPTGHECCKCGAGMHPTPQEWDSPNCEEVFRDPAVHAKGCPNCGPSPLGSGRGAETAKASRELGLLRSHLHRGGQVTAWQPRHIPPGLLSGVAENMAKGMSAGEACDVAKLALAAGARKGASGYSLNKRSGMISLDLPEGLIAPVPGGVDDHHITVVYLGPDVDDAVFAAACERARNAAAGAPALLAGHVSGLGSFPASDSSDGKTPVFAHVSLPGAEVLREALADLSASEHTEWHPHVTLAYLSDGDEMPAPVPHTPVTFTHLSVHRGGSTTRYPLGPQALKSSGESYVTCGEGHRHWGAHGAAGLLIRAKDAKGKWRYLLQRRGDTSDHPGTWGIPGGALHEGEPPPMGAVREATEELGVLPNLRPKHTVTDDHEGWAYHTILTDAPAVFQPHTDGLTSHETGGWAWLTAREVESYPLHPGFAQSWQQVRLARRSKTLTKDGGTPVDASVVYHEMREKFPPGAIAWVKDATWAVADVPLSSVDFEDSRSWSATTDPDRVQHFARQYRAGQHVNMPVLVDEPGSAKFGVVDGHHRELGARDAGKHSVPAYVGRVPAGDGRWRETHSSQRDHVGKSAQTPVVSTVHHPLGHEGLWHTPDRHVATMQELPAYFQNTARALAREHGGTPESRIAEAVAAVREWSEGSAFGGKVKVTPEVQAAASRAMSEWDRLKASHT